MAELSLTAKEIEKLEYLHEIIKDNLEYNPYWTLKDDTFKEYKRKGFDANNEDVTFTVIENEGLKQTAEICLTPSGVYLLTRNMIIDNSNDFQALQELMDIIRPFLEKIKKGFLEKTNQNEVLESWRHE